MKIEAVVALGVILVLAGIAAIAYDCWSAQTPVLGGQSGQEASVDYMAFFGFALGGGGFLILLFSVFQWRGKRRPR